jgi:hypothetical protein
MLTFNEFINEAQSPLKHKINSEKYWKRILHGNDFAMKILVTVLTKQNGMATDRQWEVLKRAESGDKTPYHPKN